MYTSSYAKGYKAMQKKKEKEGDEGEKEERKKRKKNKPTLSSYSTSVTQQEATIPVEMICTTLGGTPG